VSVDQLCYGHAAAHFLGWVKPGLRGKPLHGDRRRGERVAATDSSVILLIAFGSTAPAFSLRHSRHPLLLCGTGALFTAYIRWGIYEES
jgi:hypothetical protein